MPNMETKQGFDSVVTDLADGMVDLVKKIESKLSPTTRNHYGDYMAIILQLADGKKTVSNIVALALIQAGANRQGVLDALENAV